MTKQCNDAEDKKTTLPFSASNILVRYLVLSIDVIYRHWILASELQSLSQAGSFRERRRNEHGRW